MVMPDRGTGDEVVVLGMAASSRRTARDVAALVASKARVSRVVRPFPWRNRTREPRRAASPAFRLGALAGTGYAYGPARAAPAHICQKVGNVMGWLLLILLLALILGGFGFVVHALWWVAIIVFIVWLVSFVVGRR
jgi:hypothetical protein